MYNATIYKHTGFNTINVPGSPSVLNLVQDTFTVPALDIYQARQLESFVVRANRQDLEDADYLYLVNSEDNTDFAYYAIDKFVMTSKDTAILYVSRDPSMTAGGIINIDYLDGIVERHHVKIADDTFGAFDEPDAYLNPSEMLKIEPIVPDFKSKVHETDPDDVVDGDAILIQSTVDMKAMYDDITSVTDEAVAINYYVRGDVNEDSVCVPSVYPAKPVGNPAKYTTTSLEWGLSPTEKWTTEMTHSILYAAQFGTKFTGMYWIADGLAWIRSLGVESCITAQYAIPAYMLKTPTYVVDQDAGRIDNLIGRCIHYGLSELPFIKSYGSYHVQNNRIFYGDNVKYTIVSLASGNSATFLPEEIYHRNSNTYPIISLVVDPRPNGSPYFRFVYYRGNKDHMMFFTNAVKGLGWQNVPLMYEGKSGWLLDQYAYNAKYAIEKEGADYAAKQLYASHYKNQLTGWSSWTSDVGNLGLSLAEGAISSNVGGHFAERTAAYVGNAAQSGLNIITKPMALAIDKEMFESTGKHIRDQYNAERNAEMQSLLLNQEVVAPTINFPISESIRDYVGNTCLVYRTYYSDNDVRRIDKILNMYGYRHTTVMDKSLLTNRTKFNYIKATGVSVANKNIPKWLREEIADQLSMGIRVWHTLPDINAYTDGTNTDAT